MRKLNKNSLFLLFLVLLPFSLSSNEIDEALVLEQSGNYKAAVEYYRIWLYSAANRDIPLKRYFDILVHAASLIDSPESSIEFLNNCLDQNPPDEIKISVMEYIGELYILLGQYESASNYYLSASELTGNNSKGYSLLLTSYQLRYKYGDYSYLEQLKEPMGHVSGEILTEYSNLHALTLYQLGYGKKALILLQRISSLDKFEPNTDFHRLMLFFLETNNQDSSGYLSKLSEKQLNSLELNVYSGEIPLLFSPGDIIH